MRVRAVDAQGDMRFGGDQASILRDSPEAVGQIVESRLMLWQGEWYLDRAEGTPYEQEVLGRRTEGLRDLTLKARILDTPGVTQIKPGSYTSTLNRQTRALVVAATVQTAYSRAYLAGPDADPRSITIKVENGR